MTTDARVTFFLSLHHMVAIWTTTFHAINTTYSLSAAKGKQLQVYTLKTTTDQLQSSCCSTKLPNNRLPLSIRNFYTCKPSQGIQKTPLLNSLRGKYFCNSAGHTKRRSFSSSLFVQKVTVEWLALLSSRFESQSTDRHSYMFVFLSCFIPLYSTPYPVYDWPPSNCSKP